MYPQSKFYDSNNGYLILRQDLERRHRVLVYGDGDDDDDAYTDDVSVWIYGEEQQ